MAGQGGEVLGEGGEGVIVALQGECERWSLRMEGWRALWGVA